MRRGIVAALVLALSAGLTSTAHAQATAPVGQKDPATGVLFGLLITGGGQFYAHRYGKGAAELAVAVMATVAGVNASSITRCTLRAADGRAVRGDCVHNTPLYVGIGVATASWLFGVITAAHDVNAYNRRTVATVVPVLQPAPGGGVRVGVAIPLGR